MPEAVLGAIIVAPALLTFLLKSNAAVAYLALCAGFVLSTSVIGNLKHLLSQTNLSLANDTLAMLLLAVPYVLTLLLTRKSHDKQIHLYLQLIVAVLGGGLLALSIAPLITNNSLDMVRSSLWVQLAKYQAAVIGAGAILALIMVWLPQRHQKKH